MTRLKAAKKKFFNVSTASVAVMKAQREMKKDAKRAVELIEKILEDEPYNKQANLALKEAAVAAGWLETGGLRAANIARRECARYQTAARTGAALSRAGRERARGRDLQSDQRDRSGRCRRDEAWEKMLRRAIR